MAAPTTIPGTVYIGTLSCGSFTPPAASVSNAAIAAGSSGNYVAAEKLEHMAPGGMGGSIELYGPTTAVAALTKTLGMAKGAGDIVSFGAWIEVVATGADRTITVDLHRSTGGGAYATVLSATVGFTNGSTVRSLVSGTLSSTTFAAGDIFRVVVTVAGAAGAQATGLSVYLGLHEEPA